MCPLNLNPSSHFSYDNLQGIERGDTREPLSSTFQNQRKLPWSLSPPVLAHHFLSLFLLSSVCLCLGVKFVLVFQSWDTSWVPALWLHAPGSNELTCSSSSHFMCGGLPSVFAGLKLVPLLVVFAMFFLCESYLPCCLLSGNRRAGTCAW